jgi:hypothetical protein
VCGKNQVVSDNGIFGGMLDSPNMNSAVELRESDAQLRCRMLLRSDHGNNAHTTSNRHGISTLTGYHLYSATFNSSRTLCIGKRDLQTIDIKVSTEPSTSDGIGLS